MENLNEALFLLVVGMLTVFVILMLVVAVGNLIILFTNRF
jgi:oxaloacetate decarboxylase gamma subunit